MDKNSVIGVVLIAVLLLIYYNYFSPTPTVNNHTEEEGIIAESGDILAQKKVPPSVASLKDQAVAPFKDQVSSQNSPELLQAGPLTSLLKGEKKIVNVENEDLLINFSTLGGIIKSVELKQFKAFDQSPLLLVTESSSAFSLWARHVHQDVDLYALYYNTHTFQREDSTFIVFTATVGDSISIHQTYAIPAHGFSLTYRIALKGLGMDHDAIAFTWINDVPLQEKDMTSSRVTTTVNYYSDEQGFDGLSENSTNVEEEILIHPIKWVAIKQKFFISSVIAKTNFRGGEVKTSVDPLRTQTVKQAHLTLFLPRQELANGGVEFSYFFGPVDYSTLSDVADGFSKNLSLGWPPILWVNRFLIIPIFKLLENYISSYGIIIILMVLIIKLLLSPLSYKSYLGMAKMRLLKPELDILKEKCGSDMSKMQQEQLKIYKQAGVNPFSGCIPLVLQMPILLAMFYFFPVSIELRQSSFLWAHDLSTYDSIATLPFTIPFYGNHVSLFVLLMTASSLIYTWQNNQISSVQGPMKSVSYMMPLIFLFVLNSFSAGLSLYYFVSNLITFAQQALIRKFVDEEKIKSVMADHKRKNISQGGMGGGKKSRFMTKLQEAMKMSEKARREKENKK